MTLLIVFEIFLRFLKSHMKVIKKIGVESYINCSTEEALKGSQCFHRTVKKYLIAQPLANLLVKA